MRVITNRKLYNFFSHNIASSQLLYLYLTLTFLVTGLFNANSHLDQEAFEEVEYGSVDTLDHSGGPTRVFIVALDITAAADGDATEDKHQKTQ